jgi:hypothetical protein
MSETHVLGPDCTHVPLNLTKPSGSENEENGEERLKKPICMTESPPSERERFFPMDMLLFQNKVLGDKYVGPPWRFKNPKDEFMVTLDPEFIYTDASDNNLKLDVSDPDRDIKTASESFHSVSDGDDPIRETMLEYGPRKMNSFCKELGEEKE